MTLTYYHILGVNEDATLAEIKRAFRKISKRDHPDHNPGDTAAEARFKIASEAYATLSDPAKRKAYDAQMKQAAPPSNGAQPEPEVAPDPPSEWTQEEREAYERFSGKAAGPSQTQTGPSYGTPPPNAPPPKEPEWRPSVVEPERKPRGLITLAVVASIAILIVLLGHVVSDGSGNAGPSPHLQALEQEGQEKAERIHYGQFLLTGKSIGPYRLALYERETVSTGTPQEIKKQFGPSAQEYVAENTTELEGNQKGWKRFVEQRNVKNHLFTLIYEYEQASQAWNHVEYRASPTLLDYCTSDPEFRDAHGIGVGSSITAIEQYYQDEPSLIWEFTYDQWRMLEVEGIGYIQEKGSNDIAVIVGGLSTVSILHNLSTFC